MDNSDKSLKSKTKTKTKIKKSTENIRRSTDYMNFRLSALGIGNNSEFSLPPINNNKTVNVLSKDNDIPELVLPPCLSKKDNNFKLHFE